MLHSAGSKYVTGCAALLAVIAASPVVADEFVSGHFRSNGKFVAPYIRSSADGNFYNNFSTKPNFNPYNFKRGTRVNPPNSRSPSYFDSPRYLSLPAAPRSAIVTAPYVPYFPPLIDHGAAESARKAAEAARAVEFAAAAKAYADAKAQAIATARANSDQRRKAFGRDVEAERSKLAGEFEARKSEIVAEHAGREPATIESDKAELRARYREQLGQFDRDQAAVEHRLKAEVGNELRRLADDDAERQAVAAEVGRGRIIAAGERSVASLIGDIYRDKERQFVASSGLRIKEHFNSAISNRTAFIQRAENSARVELASRIDRRRAQNDFKIATMKASHDLDASQRIAKLEGEFESAEGERFAADQERAERRFLAYIHGRSIDTTLEAEPVVYSHPATSAQAVEGSALTLSVVAGLGLLLALGAILAAQSKPTDFRQVPPGK